jgi:biopolymer transport protein ExbD
MRRKRYLLSRELETEDSLINLTPLIDVVFVLLIAFMIVAPLINVEHVDLVSGGIHATRDAKSSSITITLKADSTIWLQEKQMDLGTLKNILSLNTAQTPQMITDKGCPFGVYQDVKNVLEECGFEQMDVLVQ